MKAIWFVYLHYPQQNGVRMMTIAESSEEARENAKAWLTMIYGNVPGDVKISVEAPEHQDELLVQ